MFNDELLLIDQAHREIDARLISESAGLANPHLELSALLVIVSELLGRESDAIFYIDEDRRIIVSNDAGRCLIAEGRYADSGYLDPSCLAGWQIEMDMSVTPISGAPGIFMARIKSKSRPQNFREAASEAFGLTQAEAVVAEHIFEGLSANDVASMRNCSVNTVKTQLKHVFQKLQVNSRDALVRKLSDAVGACPRRSESEPLGVR